MQNRFFLRRAAAFVIDLIWGLAAFTVIAVLVHTYGAPEVLPPQISPVSQCRSVAVQDPATADKLLPLANGEQHAQILCMVTDQIFEVTHYMTRLVNFNKTTAVTTTHFITYPSDRAGHGIAILSTGVLIRFLLPLLFALFLARAGFTPGKRLLGLRVIRKDGLKTSLGHTLLREYARFLPLLIISIPGLVTTLQDALFPGAMAKAKLLDTTTALIGGASSPETIIRTMAAVSVVIVLTALAYWFLPFLRWRGQTPWDWLAGTQVEAHASPLFKTK